MAEVVSAFIIANPQKPACSVCAANMKQGRFAVCFEKYGIEKYSVTDKINGMKNTEKNIEKKSYEKPLAYFITFRTYGTWHHGDERLSVDRIRNIYNTPKINPNKNLKKQMQEAQRYDSIVLTREQGNIILEASVTACNKYDWRLYALHIRSNHVHLTITSDDKPEHIMTEIKAHATRLLRKRNEFSKEQKIWSRHGSTKYIWSPESLYYTSDYTTEQQGQKMAYVFNL